MIIAFINFVDLVNDVISIPTDRFYIYRNLELPVIFTLPYFCGISLLQGDVFLLQMGNIF